MLLQRRVCLQVLGLLRAKFLPWWLGQFCAIKIGLKTAYAKKQNLLFLSHVDIFGLLQCSGFLVSKGRNGNKKSKEWDLGMNG